MSVFRSRTFVWLALFIGLILNALFIGSYGFAETFSAIYFSALVLFLHWLINQEALYE